ncbi:hypothetical protein Psfp_04139 [Pelotomaculum sp. FP]|uniref:hypothetical protein n=1 Tax=Pelotomaculum sp. FP TaxID=261474 RepID=UPI0010664B1C|nr:hypothetical protein [Pelotomaculum sp. FP]TEB10601.1 hypothetical protein Psfp_04139 [Pelotomaculum sp. FP]
MSTIIEKPSVKASKMSREDLVAYIVDQFMDDYNNPIGLLSENVAKTCEEDHLKAVSKLADLALSCGADREKVKKAAGAIDDRLLTTYVHVGDQLYFHGFIERLKLMGQYVTMGDIQKGIDKANDERHRANLEWVKQIEKERLCREVDEKFRA